VPVLPIDIKSNGADHLKVPESMPGPVAFTAAGFRQGIHISYIPGFTGQFEKESFAGINSQPAFRTGIITGNMKLVIQPVAPPGKIRTRDIDPGPDFPYTAQQLTVFFIRKGQIMLLHIIKVKKVSPVRMFKMQEAGSIQDTVAINRFSINPSGHMDHLPFVKDILGMIKISFDGAGMFFIQVKTKPVIVLGKRKFPGFINDGLKAGVIMCPGFMQSKIISIGHPEMDITAGIPLYIIAPLKIETAASVFLLLGIRKLGTDEPEKYQRQEFEHA